MSLSAGIRGLWREVEDVMTAATGPLLILSSAVSTSDIFSNQTFSQAIPQLPAIWAIARALAVTMWLGVAFEYYLDARRRAESGFWWFGLTIILFVVDLQTATLFAFQAEHISDLGEWSVLRIPAIDWAIEQAVLGVILIAVHRAVIHHVKPVTSITVAPVRQVVTGHTPALDAPLEEPVLLAEPAAPSQPLTHTPRARRRDSGSTSPNRKRNVERVVAMLREDPKISLDAIMERLNVTRAAAVQYRQEARLKVNEV